MPQGISPTTGEEYYSRWQIVDKPKGKKWLCRCSCGVERMVRYDTLKSGQSRSCGCLQKETAAKIARTSLIDLTGKTFGRLQVTCRASNSKNGRVRWHCLCECGKKVTVRSNSLMRGNTSSCGCLHSELARKRLYNPNITDKERALSVNRDLDPRNAVWRDLVYERDEYVCQKCGDDQGGNLVAHHKDGYGWCKERRYDASNGVTLCRTCHDNFHSKFGLGNNTERQWNYFFAGELPKRRVIVRKDKEDLQGMKFGMLTVSGKATRIDGGRLVWPCVCDCGTETTSQKYFLKSGKKTSCGCDKGCKIREKKFDDITGKRFGILSVVGLFDGSRIKWNCQCDCGRTRVAYRSQLVKGQVENCSYYSDKCRLEV